MTSVLRVMMFAAAAAAAGCAGDGPETGAVTTHPVRGRVLYDGKPAAGVRVTLFPEDAPTRPRIPQNPRGVTGPDGRFAIGTFADDDGAAAGGYQVIMTWPPDAESAAAAGAEEATDIDRFFGWYDATHSKIRVRVNEGPNELKPFDLPKKTGPPPPSEGVPGRN